MSEGAGARGRERRKRHRPPAAGVRAVRRCCRSGGGGALLGSVLFQRSAWAGLIGGFLDHRLSLHGLLAALLAMLVPLTVRPAVEEEHSAMTLAGMGALTGSTLAVAAPVFVAAGTGMLPHALTAATMITMGASMGGMLGGGWQAWRQRQRPT